MNQKELKKKITHCNSEIRKNLQIISTYRDRIDLHSLCISGQERIIRELKARGEK